MTGDDGTPVVVPVGLRARVLEASRAARAAGRPAPDPVDISAVEAFGRAAAALDGLLGPLGEQDWDRTVLRDLDVQGLIGHLVGVEADMAACLSGDSRVASADHVESTQPAADRQAGRPPAGTCGDWRDGVERTLHLVEAVGDLATPGAIDGMRLPLEGLLVARAFEMWTHENDIRAATAREPSVPDPSVLRRMTDLAAVLLPSAAARAGMRAPTVVHLVLTGPGGGTWDVRIAAAGPDPVGVRIVAPALGFCRVVAGRLDPVDLDASIDGDAVRAEQVLAVAGSLALD